MLSDTDKQTILKDFPNIKLSYENITHKKFTSLIMLYLYQWVKNISRGFLTI